MKFRQIPRRLNHARRLVSPATKRYGGQIRAVRFYQQALNRKGARHAAQVISFFESEIAGERNVETNFNRVKGHLQTAAKAMQHPGAVVSGQFFLQSSDGVVVSFA